MNDMKGIPWEIRNIIIFCIDDPKDYFNLMISASLFNRYLTRQEKETIKLLYEENARKVIVKDAGYRNYCVKEYQELREKPDGFYREYIPKDNNNLNDCNFSDGHVVEFGDTENGSKEVTYSSGKIFILEKTWEGRCEKGLRMGFWKNHYTEEEGNYENDKKHGPWKTRHGTTINYRYGVVTCNYVYPNKKFCTKNINHPSGSTCISHLPKHHHYEIDEYGKPVIPPMDYGDKLFLKYEKYERVGPGVAEYKMAVRREKIEKCLDLLQKFQQEFEKLE